MRRSRAGRWLEQPALWLGAAIVGLVLVATVWPERLAPYGPEQRAPVMQEIQGRLSMAPYAPSNVYLIGTDDLGRDLLSRVIHGARVTLPLALLTALVRIGLGILLGWLAIGTAGDVRGAVLALANASAAMPSLFFAYLVIAAIGPAVGIAVFVLGIGLTGWAPWAQLIYHGVQRIQAAPYMEGATAVGITPAIRVRHYLLPNLMPVVVPSIAQEVGATLLIVAELGFVGLYRGVPRLITIDDFQTPGQLPPLPLPEWGGMLAGTRFEVFAHYWIPLAPAAAFALTIFGFYLLAEGLRSALDIPHPGWRLASVARPRTRRAVWQRRAAVALPALLAVVIGIWWAAQPGGQASDASLPTASAPDAQATAQANLIKSAQSALKYGHYDLAEERLRAVLAQDPANAEAQAGLQAIEQGRQYAAQYAQARQLADAGRWAEALPVLRALLAERPDDADAAALLAQGEQTLRFAEAEAAFAAGDWATAIADYATLRQDSPAFQPELVTERLYYGLVQQAAALTARAGNDSALLQDARGLYDQALRLRPRDDQVRAQYARLQTYLSALAALGQGDQGGAIAQLTQVWQEQPDFAGGEVARRLAGLFGAAARAAAGQGDITGARDRYTQAIAIVQAGGLPMLDVLMATHLELADLLQQNGEFAGASAQFLAAADALAAAAAPGDLLARIGYPASPFNALVQLGDTSAQRQDWASAALLYHRALTVRDAANIPTVAPALAQGETAQAAGDDQGAARIYQQAIAELASLATPAAAQP